MQVWPGTLLLLAAVLLAAPLQASAHRPSTGHGCGRGPFGVDMSMPRPAALSDPVLGHPWVQANVLVSFDPLLTKDGLGSQVHRLFAAHAVAACARLSYVHTAGFRRFTHLNGSAAGHAARRMNTLLGLPQQPLLVNSTHRVVTLGRSCNITWADLVGEVKAALAAKQPTLLSISFTYGFALAYPAMLGCVPAFQQQDMRCAAGDALMRPIRIGVHIRAGDAEGDPNRLLPHDYYFSIIKAVTKELHHLQRDYVVEVYTQAAYGIRHRADGSYHRIPGDEYVQSLHANIGHHMLLLADMDVLWTLSQMATADVFIHSKSTLSIAAGIMNTKGINIAPPAGSLPWPWLQAPHWLHAANASGAFEGSMRSKLASQLRARFGPQCPGHLLTSPALLPPLQAGGAVFSGVGAPGEGDAAADPMQHTSAR